MLNVIALLIYILFVIIVILFINFIWEVEIFICVINN